MRTFIFAFTCAIAACGGKKDEVAEYVAQHRAPIDKVFDTVEDYAGRKLAAPTKLDYAAPPLTAANTILVLGDRAAVHEIRTSSDMKTRMSWIETPTAFAQAGRLLGPKLPPWNEKTAGDVFGKVAAYKYVVVVTIAREDYPKEQGSGYVSGHFEGALHVFDLAGKYYGGVPWEAKNSSAVGYTQRSTSNDLGKQASEQIILNARRAIHDTIAKHVPGSDVPAGPLNAM